MGIGLFSGGSAGGGGGIGEAPIDGTPYSREDAAWVSATSGGTVTNVATGIGLDGGPITTTGTINLADTAVTPAAYTNADITVDAQGRITAAASGSGGGAVDSVNTQTGVVVLDADDISDSATTNKYTTAGDITKLSGIETGAEVNVAVPVQEEGVQTTADPSAINFVGAGVTATDTAGVATITIPGGGGGSLEVQEEGVQTTAAATVMNFVGTGVTATDVGGVATITVPSGALPASFDIDPGAPDDTFAMLSSGAVTFLGDVDIGGTLRSISGDLLVGNMDGPGRTWEAKDITATGGFISNNLNSSSSSTNCTVQAGVFSTTNAGAAIQLFAKDNAGQPRNTRFYSYLSSSQKISMEHDFVDDEWEVPTADFKVTLGQVFGATVKTGSYTVATVPSASTEGAGTSIYVTDETGGSVLATSDGTNWRRSTDRAIVS